MEELDPKLGKLINIFNEEAEMLKLMHITEHKDRKGYFNKSLKMYKTCDIVQIVEKGFLTLTEHPVTEESQLVPSKASREFRG